MSELYIAILGGLAAMLASIIAAFSGGGLSLILFPVLLIIAPYPYISLLAVSKVSAALMSVTSARIHALKSKLDWKFLLFIAGFQLLGTGVGTYLVQYQFNEEFFTKLLGWTVLLTSIYLFFAKKIGLGLEEKRVITKYVYVEAAIFCFTFSILNGIFGGTGIFITIYFIAALRMTFIEAMAYVMPSFAVVNVLQTAYLLTTESVEWKLVGMVIVGSILGAWFGTHLQYLKGNLWIKRAAVIVMFIIGCKTLLG